jgi:hypothetical protein
MARDYKKEYADYHGTAAQKKRRAERNKSRSAAIKKGTAKKGDGLEVHHINAPRLGSLSKVKTAVVSRSYNRKRQPSRGGKKS